MSATKQVLQTLVVEFVGDSAALEATVKNVKAQMESLKQAAEQAQSQAADASKSYEQTVKETSAATSKATESVKETAATTSTALTEATSKASEATNTATEATKTAIDSAKEMASTASSAITEAVTKATTGLKETASAAVDAVKQPAKSISAAMNSAGGQIGILRKKIQGLSSATVIAWGVALTVAAYKFSEWLSGYSDAMERAAKMQEKLADHQKELANASVGRADSLYGETKTKYLQDELAMVEKNMKGQAAAAEHAKQVLDEMESSWLSLPGNRVVKQQRAELEELSKQCNETSKHADELRKALRLQKEVDALQVASDVEKLGDSIKKQIATFGQAGSAAQIYDLQLRGATKEQIAEIQKLDKQYAEMQRTASLEATIKDWELQAATIGMTTRQVEIYKAARDGATQAELAAMKAQDAKSTAMEQAAEQAKTVEDLKNKWKEQAETIGMSARELEIYNAKLKGIDTAELEKLNAGYTAQETAREQAQRVEELTKQWQEQAATVGMNSREIEIYKMKLEGLDTTKLEALNETLENQDTAKETAKSVAALTERLKEQAATLGMTSIEAELWKLAQQGATEAELAEAKAIAANIEQRKEQVKEADKQAKELMAKQKQEVDFTLNFASKGLGQVQEDFLRLQGMSGAKIENATLTAGMNKPTALPVADMPSTDHRKWIPSNRPFNSERSSIATNDRLESPFFGIDPNFAGSEGAPQSGTAKQSAQAGTSDKLLAEIADNTKRLLLVTKTKPETEIVVEEVDFS